LKGDFRLVLPASPTLVQLNLTGFLPAAEPSPQLLVVFQADSDFVLLRKNLKETTLFII
jgi:hypothetical protein